MDVGNESLIVEVTEDEEKGEQPAPDAASLRDQGDGAHRDRLHDPRQGTVARLGEERLESWLSPRAADFWEVRRETVARMYYDADADLGRLRGKRVAILGFGEPGARPRPQPQGQRGGRGGGAVPRLRVQGQGRGAGAGGAAERRGGAGADVVMFTIPDQVQRQVYQGVAPHRAGTGRR